MLRVMNKIKCQNMTQVISINNTDIDQTSSTLYYKKLQNRRQKQKQT